MNITDMMKQQRKVLNGIYDLLRHNDTPAIRALLDEKIGPHAFDDLEKYCDNMSRAADTAIELDKLAKAMPDDDDDESFLD